MAYDEAPRLYTLAASLPGIEVAGVHMHIGSQLTDLAPFRQAFTLLRELILRLRGEGHTIAHADLGGGLGVPYQAGNAHPPHPSEYAAIVREAFADLDVQLAFEPGRMIAANAGILVARAIYAKAGHEKTVLVVDAAMNDLIRPTLYDAHHDIQAVDEAVQAGPRRDTDVVGPVCETGDYLALARALPVLEAGDLLAIMTAGAYGAVQSGTYNTRPLIPEVLVKGSEWAVVRRRTTYEEMLALDTVPDWISS